jgi:hypothetical protein
MHQAAVEDEKGNESETWIDVAWQSTVPRGNNVKLNRSCCRVLLTEPQFSKISKTSILNSVKVKFVEPVLFPALCFPFIVDCLVTKTTSS